MLSNSVPAHCPFIFKKAVNDLKIIVDCLICQNRDNSAHNNGFAKVCRKKPSSYTTYFSWVQCLLCNHVVTGAYSKWLESTIPALMFMLHHIHGDLGHLTVNEHLFHTLSGMCILNYHSVSSFSSDLSITVSTGQVLINIWVNLYYKNLWCVGCYAIHFVPNVRCKNFWGLLKQSVHQSYVYQLGDNKL